MNKVITPEKGFNLRLMPMWDGAGITSLIIEVDTDVNDPIRHDIILEAKDIIELREYLITLPICGNGK